MTPPGGGFSLVELILALLLFQVGLLAVASLIFQAQETLISAEGRLRALLAAQQAGDSILIQGPGESGRIAYSWGSLHWEPGWAGDGVLLTAVAPNGRDTLLVLPMWPLVSRVRPLDSLQSEGEP